MSPLLGRPSVRSIARTAESGLSSALPAFAGAYGGLLAGTITVAGVSSAVHDALSMGFFYIAAVLVPAFSLMASRRGRLRDLARVSPTRQGVIIDVATLLVVYGVVRSIWAVVLSSGTAVSAGSVLASPFGIAVVPSIALIVLTFVRVRDRMRPGTRGALGLLGVFLWGGVLLVSLLNPDPRWWEQSVSFLGSRSNLASDVFNAAIFGSAILLAATATSVTFDMGRLAEGGRVRSAHARLIALCLTVSAVGLFNVAVFPNKPFGRGTTESWIHNGSAYAFFVLMALLMWSMRWLVPAVGLRFKNLDWTLSGFAFLTFALYIVGYMPLAIFEILSMAAMSVWFVLFVAELGQTAAALAPLSDR